MQADQLPTLVQDRHTILRLTTVWLRQLHASNRWMQLTAQLLQWRVLLQRVLTGSRTDEGVRWMITEVASINARTAQAEQLNNIRAVASYFLALSRFPRLLRE